MSASDNPILRSEFGPSEQLALPEHTSAPGFIASVGEWIGNTQNRARQLKQEYPLRLLGVLMGSAFVFGIAIRIWSSHER